MKNASRELCGVRYHTDAERITKNIQIDQETRCWNWQRRIQRDGYGQFVLAGKKSWLAHRWSYITFVGAIPEGLEIDHLCRNRGCVNPAHLEPVTKQENLRRGRLVAVLRTRCRHGHEYTPENTGHDSLGRRYCRPCNRAAARRSYERRILRTAGIAVAS